MSRSAGKPRRWAGLRSNRGQILALYSIALPVLLGVMALALDGGKLFVSRIHVQNAADASALASSQDLGPCVDPGNPPTFKSATCDELAVGNQVRTDVNLYSGYNGGPTNLIQCNHPWFAESQFERETDGGSGDGNCYTWPYVKSDGTHWNEVEVRLRKNVNLDFAGIVGFHNPSHAWARGVGTYKPTTEVIPGAPGQPATTLFYTDDPTTNPGGVETNTTVVSGTTYTTTTVIPGATHTTTNVTSGNCTPGANCGVEFAMSSQCDAITYSGAGGGSIGSFETNGGFQASGSKGKTVDTLFLGSYPGRDANNTCYQNGGIATIKHGPFGPFSHQDWPIALPIPPTPVPVAGHPALIGNQCWNLGTGGLGQATVPGVYCATATLNFSSSYTGYTFFAPCISIGGGTNTLRYAANIPAAQGARQQTLFYASGTDVSCNGPAVSLQGGTNSLAGDVFAPSGQIAVKGGGASGGSGFMESQTFSINGNNFGYQGTGPLEGGTVTIVTTTDPDTTVMNTVTGPGSTTTTVTTHPGSTTPGQTRSVTVPGTPSTPAVTQTTATTIGLGE